MSKNINDTVEFRHGASIKSRIIQSPMQTWSGHDDGFVSEDTLEYYKRRDQSAAMVITEYLYVTESGGPARTSSNTDQQLGIYTDEQMPGLEKIARYLQASGNKAVAQIAHAGRESNYKGTKGLPVYAPSAIDFSFLDYDVLEMSQDEIENVIEDFAEATRRVIAMGFDGVEIHGANHYLLQQFFSKFSNKREDKWGGSLENRMRFPIEVTRAVFDVVKAEAPEDFIIGYRISPEEVHGSTVGYDYTESTQLIKALCDEFDFDYIHLSLPQYDSKPEGQDKTFAELFRPMLDDEAKLMIVGNVMSQEAAEDALQYTDLVAVGRATLIDPDFGLKIYEGRGDEIIREISPEQVKASKLTPGLINVFSDKNMQPALPGAESIYHLNKGGLDASVIKDGTGAAYNLDED